MTASVDPWAVFTPEEQRAHAEEVLPSTPRPIHPPSPLLGCDLHGSFWWQRGCPGCPSKQTYEHLYVRLDEWRESYRRHSEATDHLRDAYLELEGSL